MKKSYEAAQLLIAIQEVYKESKEIQYKEITEEEVVTTLKKIMEDLPKFFKSAFKEKWHGFSITTSHITLPFRSEKEKQAMLKILYPRLCLVLDELQIRHSLRDDDKGTAINVYVDRVILMLEMMS